MTPPTDVYDELAAMFMTGEDDAPNGQAAATQSQAMCEVLIVGHLPVRAGLWLAPYADAMAREHGPTALVRLDDEHPTLELLRGKRDATSRAPSLRDAIERTAKVVHCWVVRGREGGEPDELIAAQPDRVTILTGADNAAVVRTYQIIKSLHHAAERNSCPMPSCGVAILGAQEEQATHTFERIRETTRSQLGIEVAMRCLLQRIDAEVESSDFAHFDREQSPSVQAVLGWIRLSQSMRDSQPREPEPIPSRQPAADGRPTSRTMKLMPKPSVAMESKHASQQSYEAREQVVSQSLASYVDGLTPIQPRCPRRESVELAVDGNGDLHLLARESHLRDLRAVESWAHDHRELLSMACRNITLNPAANVVCHLFTETPTSVADLHSTSLHLHVLAPVKVGNETGWYAAPLNDPVVSAV